MKRAFAFILAVCLLAAAIPVMAYATESPREDPPEVVFQGCENCKIVTWSKRDVLAAGKLAIFKEAKEQLKDVTPEGFACRDYVYQDVNDNCTECDVGMLLVGTDGVDEETEAEWVRDMKAQGVCAGYLVSLSMEGVSDVVVKQYVNKEWVEKDITVDGDSIVIKAVVDGPIAIFMK